MILRAPAILVSARSHGETGVIARALTNEHGLVSAYIAGGRGRGLRPVLIPGNRVEIDLRSKSENQLPFAKVELIHSRAPWMTEPLPAAAIQWACVIAASCLAERNAHPNIYMTLDALLDAICHAPSARGWLGAMVAYEVMLLRELGYEGAWSGDTPTLEDSLSEQFETFRKLHRPIGNHLLAERARDVMAARVALGERLARMME